MLRRGKRSRVNEKRGALYPGKPMHLSEIPIKEQRIEKNAKVIEDNLQKIISECILHNVNMTVITCGYMLSPFERDKLGQVNLEGTEIVVEEELATKLKFLSLLNFRRILNTIRGVSEDFLDNLVMFQQKYPEINFVKGVDMKSLINAGNQHNFINNLNLSKEQYEYMKENTMKGFIKHMNEEKEQLFLTDFQADDLGAYLKQKRLADGVVLHKDLEFEIKNRDVEIKMLKAVIERRDKSIADMREKLLKEIIHLREALFKKQRDKEATVYRADFFETTEILDESVLKILNEKMSDMRQHYEGKLGKLNKKLEETEKKLAYYLEMDSEDNPGYATLLIKRGITSMGGNRYMLWKILQGILGKKWFQKVLLERHKGKKIGIDYDPIDSIVGDLHKILIQKHSEYLDFLQGPHGEFVYCIVDTFNKQKLEAERELELEERLLDRIKVSFSDHRRLPRTNTSKASKLAKESSFLGQVKQEAQQQASQPKKVAGEGENGEGSEDDLFEKQPKAFEQEDLLEVSVTKTVKNEKDSNTKIRDLREALETPIDVGLEKEKADKMSPEEIKMEYLTLKKREKMLLNEIKNLQRERYSARKALHVSDKRYKMLVNFIKKTMKKLKLNWDTESFTKTLMKLKLLDADELKRAGIDRSIKKGRTNLLAKMVIHSMTNNTKIDKSTNTNSDEYSDLAKDSDLVLWVTARLNSVTGMNRRTRRTNNNNSSMRRGSGTSGALGTNSSQFSTNSRLNSKNRRSQNRRQGGGDLEEIGEKSPRNADSEGIESLEAGNLINDNYQINTTEEDEDLGRKKAGGSGRQGKSGKVNSERTAKRSAGARSKRTNGGIRKGSRSVKGSRNRASKQNQNEKSRNRSNAVIEGDINKTVKDSVGDDVNDGGGYKVNTEGTQEDVPVVRQKKMMNTQSFKAIKSTKNAKGEEGVKSPAQSQKQMKTTDQGQQTKKPPSLTDDDITLKASGESIADDNHDEDQGQDRRRNSQKTDIDTAQMTIEDYLESLHDSGRIPTAEELRKIVEKAVQIYQELRQRRKSIKIKMHLLDTIQVTGKVKAKSITESSEPEQFRQTLQLIPTSTIELEEDDQPDSEADLDAQMEEQGEDKSSSLDPGQRLLKNLQENDGSGLTPTLSGRSSETMIRLNVEAMKEEIRKKKIREEERLKRKQHEEKLKREQEEAGVPQKVEKMTKKQMDSFKKKLNDKIMKVFDNGGPSRSQQTDNPKKSKQQTTDLPDNKKSTQRHIITSRRSELPNPKTNQSLQRIRGSSSGVGGSAGVNFTAPDGNTLSTQYNPGATGKTGFGGDRNYLPQLQGGGQNNTDDVFNQHSASTNLSRRMRRLENAYSYNNNAETIHERLYNDHIVKDIIKNEKKTLIEKYEETRWTMNLLDQGVILYDINGVSLVYDTDTSKTFLDIRRAVRNFKDSENKFDYNMLSRDPRPTYITELNNTILKEVKNEFYEVQSHKVDSANSNNFIPVEKMSDGEMGITLNSLSLVIHKIFNQIYGLKKRVSKTTQTVPGGSMLSNAERRKKLDYLIRGLRGGKIGQKYNAKYNQNYKGGMFPTSIKGRGNRGFGMLSKSTDRRGKNSGKGYTDRRKNTGAGMNNPADTTF